MGPGVVQGLDVVVDGDGQHLGAAGNVAADDLVRELEALAPGLRLEAQVDVAELAVPAGLPLEAGVLGRALAATEDGGADSAAKESAEAATA